MWGFVAPVMNGDFPSLPFYGWIQQNGRSALPYYVENSPCPRIRQTQAILI